MAKKTYSLEELKAFELLAGRLRELEGEFQKLQKRQELLRADRETAEAERRDILKRIDREFADLKSLKLFGVADNQPKVDLERTGYVKHEEKEALLKTIIENFKQANPDADKISYTQIKNTLSQTYSIETKSISNFFIGLLDGYKTVGGNRNKAIVIE